jgi:hypothetical protein
MLVLIARRDEMKQVAQFPYCVPELGTPIDPVVTHASERHGALRPTPRACDYAGE